MKKIFFALVLATSITTAFANEEELSPMTITAVSVVAENPLPFGRANVSAQVSEPTKTKPSAFIDLILDAQNGVVKISDSVLAQFPSPQLGSLNCAHGLDHDGKDYVGLRFLFGTPDKQGRFSRGSIAIKDGKVWGSFRMDPDGSSRQLGN